jgi:hypothetical protein
LSLFSSILCPFGGVLCSFNSTLSSLRELLRKDLGFSNNLTILVKYFTLVIDLLACAGSDVTFNEFADWFSVFV